MGFFDFLGFGDGGKTTTTQSNEPWSGVKQPWMDLISQGQALTAGGGMQPYGGQRVYDFNPMQGAGYQMLNDYMLQGTPERAAGGAAVLNATQGNMNPYATQMNPYGGNNPYLQQMIGNSNDQIAQNFAKGTQAQADSAAARQGAFGGSAYEENRMDNSKTLGNMLSNNTNSLLQQQYNNSQGIAENALNRATGAYDSTQNRALQGAQIGQGQQGIDLQAILAGIQGGGGLADYQQKLLDANRSMYNEQQQQPYQNLDWMKSLLQGASGQGGTQSTTSPGASPWSTLGGLGLLGASLFKMFP